MAAIGEAAPLAGIHVILQSLVESIDRTVTRLKSRHFVKHQDAMECRDALLQYAETASSAIRFIKQYPQAFNSQAKAQELLVPVAELERELIGLKNSLPSPGPDRGPVSVDREVGLKVQLMDYILRQVTRALDAAVGTYASVARQQPTDNAAAHLARFARLPTTADTWSLALCDRLAEYSKSGQVQWIRLDDDLEVIACARRVLRCGSLTSASKMNGTSRPRFPTGLLTRTRGSHVASA